MAICGPTLRIRCKTTRESGACGSNRPSNFLGGNVFNRVRGRIRHLMYFTHPKRVASYWYLRWHGVETGFGFVTLHGYPVIHRSPGSTIKLGRGTVLTSRNGENKAGVWGPVVLSTLTAHARIELVGQNGVSGSAICAASRIFLGSHSIVGVGCRLYDTDFHPVNAALRRTVTREDDPTIRTAPITVGEDVWIGANSLVLKGVTIGDAAIVAAGAVVTREVGTGEVVGGNPAHLLRARPNE